MRMTLLFLFASLAMAQDPLGRQLPLANNEANQLFEAQDLEGARELYEELYEKDPENGALAYNLGNVYNALGDAEKATEFYQQAIKSKNSVAANRGRFNLGTTQMAAQSPQEAVTSFTDYLRSNPDDVDAKRNLELALRMMQQQQNQDQQQENEDQEQQENQDQQQQQQQNGENQEDEQQNQDQQQNQQNQDQQNQQNQDQQDQQNQDQQNQQNQQDEQEQNEDQQQQQNPQEGEDEQQEQQQPQNESEEDSLNDQVKEQILEALNEQELKQQKQYQQRKIGTVKRRAKDW